MVLILLPKQKYNVLIEFAHIHLDFQKCELESVLAMHGLLLNQDYTEIPLPSPNYDDNTTHPHRPFLIVSFSLNQRGKVCFPIDDTVEDNIPESLMDRYSKQTPPELVPTLATILSRCTLVRSAIELWGAGSSFEECATSVQDQIITTESQTGNQEIDIINHRLETICTENQSWKITIQTLGLTCTRENQEEMRNYFRFLNFPGPVIMENTHNEFIVIREIELESSGSPTYLRNQHDKKQVIQAHIQRPPLGVYFGRILGNNRNYRTGIEKFNLKKRVYLGPTSMDAELSFIMTSLAQVQRGSFCFDPFVGTGSLLLTCAMKGAGMCLGTDIDIRVLRGKNADESIYKNFEQYGLVRPELIRSDNSIFHRHYYPSMQSIFDAIVTDPPYGIRAGARKSGSRSSNPNPVPESERYTHIAQTKPYVVSDVMADLLDVAARTLVLGGRLVYIIPSMRDFNPETDLPRHDCLKLIHVCFQSLQIEFGRRVVTMEKTKEYIESMRYEYLSHVWLHGTESAEKCANIRERLITIAKEKANSEERKLSRKQRRLLARERCNTPMKRNVETIEKTRT